MKILVTGIRGFIGAAIATAAHAQGHEVVGVDLLSRGRALPHGVRVVQGDVANPTAWRGELDAVDVIFHSAALHHTDQIAHDPVKSIEVNLRGTRLMLEMAAECRVPRFVHLSSAKVYGEPVAFPSSEEDLLSPVEPYGLAKAVSEQMCAYFAAHSAMRCVAVRPFSVYGPGQDLSTGYIGQLLHGWHTGRPVAFAGEPEYLRDFVHVDDVVRICLAAALTDHDVAVVNAGSGDATSLRDLVTEFSSLCADGPDVRYAPARAGTITRTLADMRRGLPLLGRPPFSLREGLVDTLRSSAPEGRVHA